MNDSIDITSPEDLARLEQLQRLAPILHAVSQVQGQVSPAEVQAPAADVPYNFASQDLNNQAGALQTQAAPTHGPTSTMGKIGEGLRAGLEGFTGGLSGGPGYFEHQQARDAAEHQRQQDLLNRAKELRGEGMEQTKMGQGALKEQQDVERYNKAQAIQEGHYQAEQVHQTNTEDQAKAALAQKVISVPEHSNLVREATGAPVGPAAVPTPDKKIDQYVNKAGKRMDVFQKENGDTYEREFSDVRPPPTASFGQNNPPADEETVTWLARQIQANPLNWNMTAGNKTVENQVRAKLAGGGADVKRLTSSTRQLGETSAVIVPKIDKVLQELQDPKVISALGPVMGRWNEFMTGKVGTNDPVLSHLRATLSMLQTGTMRAHVGARGSGELLKKFEGLIDGTKMDASTLSGSLTGVRDFLQGYADNIAPDLGGGSSGVASPDSLVTPGGALERLLKRPH